MRLSLVVPLSLLCTFALAQTPLGERLYPVGDAFPLGLYSLNPDEDMPEAREVGWNISHTYHFKPEFLDTSQDAGLYALARLKRVEDDETGDATRAAIKDLASRDALGWWDLPEEMRHWRADEWANVVDLSEWTRESDPLQRPNFMYLPGHYVPEAVAKYVPYLDIIGTGCYTEYVHQPRPWVRWRIETQIEAIERAGYTVGRDYLNKERVPIGVLMLFYVNDMFDVITPVEAYHDFYSSICAGAKGILVYSYWHKRDTPVLQKTYEAYCKAAREIVGEEQLGKVFLFGEPYKGASFGITSGAQMGAAFTPYGYDTELRYPSLNIRALTWEGNLYVLAVSSAERGIKATITGLPEGCTEAEVLFEEMPAEGEEEAKQPRTVPVVNGTISDSFGWLGVHIYKMPLGG